MSEPKVNKKLRLMTYLSPGIPVEVFETLMRYLEEVTGQDAYLIYESRWSGPPADKTDPFTADEVDIGTCINSHPTKDKNILICFTF